MAIDIRLEVAAAEAALPELRQPALVVMGTLDPDFPDPAAEAPAVVAFIDAATRPASAG